MQTRKRYEKASVTLNGKERNDISLFAGEEE